MKQLHKHEQIAFSDTYLFMNDYFSHRQGFQSNFMKINVLAPGEI